MGSSRHSRTRKVVGLALAFPAIVAVGNLGTAVPDLVGKLRSPDAAVVYDARRALIAQRKAQIEALLAILREKPRASQASIESTIAVLGEMRAVEAVEALVSFLGYPYDDPAALHESQAWPRLTEEWWKFYPRAFPAVAALISIGEPAIPAVMRYVADKPSPFALTVLLNLRTRDEVVRMLRSAGAAERTDARRNGFRRCIEMIERVQTK